MNTDATLQQMKSLRLSGMTHAYQGQLEQPVDQQLEAHELIAHLVQTEHLFRKQKKTAYYLKLAKLRLPAIPEQVTFSDSRNLTKQQLAFLLDGSYLTEAENILITGATGCGKSYLACALGYQSCLLGNKTAYFNMNRFIEKNHSGKTGWHLPESIKSPGTTSTDHFR